LDRQNKTDNAKDFKKAVAGKAKRKLKAQGKKRENQLLGLGLFGLVGWAVAIPTVLGVALGVWIDSTWPSRFSWTLMGLSIGVVLGCLNAWYWVERERKKIKDNDT
jgi:ATP synthase protein I